jgi:hypothetical protein
MCQQPPALVSHCYTVTLVHCHTQIREEDEEEEIAREPSLAHGLYNGKAAQQQQQQAAKQARVGVCQVVCVLIIFLNCARFSHGSVQKLFRGREVGMLACGFH